jgi:hypothetical protein
MLADTPLDIPAKAGIRGAEIGAPALDPRLRGGDVVVILGSFSVRH